jgi:acetyl esterase
LKASALERARVLAGRLVVDGFFEGASRLARLHPRAAPAAHDVEHLVDIPYQEGGRREHLLDVWRPRGRVAPMPVVLYVHGGGFRILSKDTHWVMALAYARRGYLVINVNYRLSPLHRFPAALEDCAAAYAWVIAHAREYGGDVDRLILAGESAGANLVTALTVAACFERSAGPGRRVFETGVVPRATVPACGILQVSDVARFGRRRPLPSWLMDRLLEVETSYLDRAMDAAERELADPLLVLESDEEPARPLPPFFAAVGTKDPLLDDTRRLGAALQRRGVAAQTRYYPGELHAFHALVFREQARACWRDTYAFLDGVVPPSPRRPTG